MFEIDPWTYFMRDKERGIEIISEGGNSEGDRHYKMVGPGWWVSFTTNEILGRSPPMSIIYLNKEHNIPFSREELFALVEECVAIRFSQLLKVTPSEVIATFYSERYL